jgi:hypothetical protein
MQKFHQTNHRINWKTKINWTGFLLKWFPTGIELGTLLICTADRRNPTGAQILNLLPINMSSCGTYFFSGDITW